MLLIQSPEPDDVETLAAGLQKMMEDEKYREQAQRMAIERSHYYTLENIITKWENLLNKLYHDC